MNRPQPVVFLSGLDGTGPENALMRFRLTYEGPLRPTQREPEDHQPHPMAPHQHTIRKSFHKQLKRLWSTNRFLRECRVHPKFYAAPYTPADGAMWAPNPDELIPYVDAVATNYHEYGYRFVPLVREEISLMCSLDILFLRRDVPGSVVSAGEIDNRLKTIIDALRRPRNAKEAIGAPDDDEDPFFCLMEDDKQINRLTIEADTLLDPLTNTESDSSKARVIITVDVHPYHATNFNLSFAS